jgi:hypothetical protein
LALVNPSNGVPTLSAGDLHDIFFADKGSWPDGRHIFLIMAAPGSPERAVILKIIYKMSQGEYAQYLFASNLYRCGFGSQGSEFLGRD